MVKSANVLIDKLKDGCTFDSFKAWTSFMYDWVNSHTQLTPDDLGPKSLRQILKMGISNEFFTALSSSGALGSIDADGSRGNFTWKSFLDHVRERLRVSCFDLKR